VYASKFIRSISFPKSISPYTVSLSGQTRADATVSLRMARTRVSRVLDSRSKQVPLIIKASRKRIQKKKISHASYTLACFGSSWQSLGARTKFLAADPGQSNQSAGTATMCGIKGLTYFFVLPKEDGGCLPRKDFWCHPKVDFWLPP